MTIPRVGLIGSGEMGSGVGGRLHERGATVLTSLEGRSAASAARVARYGIPLAPDDDTLVRLSDVVLSIVPPGVAIAVAERIAAALARTGARPIVVDCNAIAPPTMERVAAIVQAVGARCLDAGIIGGPPRGGYDGPRIYVSGPGAADVLGLGAAGLALRVLDGPIGAASALKMNYAGITKGIAGIATAMLAAAERKGLGPALRAELENSQAEILPHLEGAARAVPPKAYRWVAEMREIATFLGDDPAAAAIYAALAGFYDEVAARAQGGRLAEDRVPTKEFHTNVGRAQ